MNVPLFVVFFLVSVVITSVFTSIYDDIDSEFQTLFLAIPGITIGYIIISILYLIVTKFYDQVSNFFYNEPLRIIRSVIKGQLDVKDELAAYFGLSAIINYFAVYFLSATTLTSISTFAGGVEPESSEQSASSIFDLIINLEAGMLIDFVPIVCIGPALIYILRIIHRNNKKDPKDFPGSKPLFYFFIIMTGIIFANSLVDYLNPDESQNTIHKQAFARAVLVSILCIGASTAFVLTQKFIFDSKNNESESYDKNAMNNS